MVVTFGLLVFELADGSIDSFSTMGGGIKLGRGEVAVDAAYAALFYFLWRFRVYSESVRKTLCNEFIATMKANPCYRRMIDQHVDEFKRDAGIDYSEALREIALRNKGQEEVSVPIEAVVRKRPFSRELILQVSNEYGDFNPDHLNVKLSYREFERCGLRVAFDFVVNKKPVSELLLPYFLVAAVLVSKLWSVST